MCDVSGQFSDTGHEHGNSHYSQRLSVVLTVSIQPGRRCADYWIILCYLFDPPLLQSSCLTTPKNNLKFHHTNIQEEFSELERF